MDALIMIDNPKDPETAREFVAAVNACAIAQAAWDSADESSPDYEEIDRAYVLAMDRERAAYAAMDQDDWDRIMRANGRRGHSQELPVAFPVN